jgi:hypothetical protein
MSAWSRLLRIGFVAVGVAALCGALPGEIHSCDTDLTDEVDHVAYCQDRCTTLCERVIACGLFFRDDAPEGVTIDELCQGECEEYFFCANPQFCDNPDRYISEAEAETCLGDWAALGCDDLVQNASECGTDFGRCPLIGSCAREELCDPPEWE